MTPEALQHWLQLGDDLARANGVPPWLAERCRAGLATFARLGFPTVRQEAWRFTDPTALAQTTFSLPAAEADLAAAAAALPQYGFGGLPCYRVVLVDGHYCPTLSELAGLPAGVRVASLAEAIRQDDGFARAHLGRQLPPGEAAFLALNEGFLQDGLCLHLPARTRLPLPLHLIHLTSGATPAAATHVRHLIVAEAQAEFTLIETCAGLTDEASLTSTVTELTLGDGAQCDYYRLQREGAGAFHLGWFLPTVGRDARLTAHVVSLGGRWTRHEVHLRFAAPGGQATLNGLYLGGAKQLHDHHTIVEHAHPHCSSRQVYKGILTGQAAGVFNGRIHVHPLAQQTDALQTNRALLLSDRARIHTKPELMIYADDVKCTHGATIGQLDEDALFYLRARGIPLATARALLTCAFAGEAIDDMRLAPIRDELADHMQHQFAHA